MAADVLAVMDALHLEKAALVGWSDGACTALILAMQNPARMAGVFYFACNMDPSGVKEFAQPNPILDRCFSSARQGLRSTVGDAGPIQVFVAAVSHMMKTQPNYFVHDLADISVLVVIVQSEHEEFIKLEHAEYLARSIPERN